MMTALLHSLQQLDVSLFHLLNRSINNPVFDQVMPFITNEHHFVIPLIIIWFGLLIFGGKRGRVAAILLLFATISADLIAAQVIKPLVGRLRPCHALEHVRLLVRCGGKYGFVSNHAANMFASMTVLALFYWKYRWYFWSLAALIAFSRVYVGVHYPGDILGGTLLGITLGWLWFSLLVVVNNYLRKQEKLWLEWRTPPPETI